MLWQDLKKVENQRNDIFKNLNNMYFLIFKNAISLVFYFLFKSCLSMFANSGNQSLGYFFSPRMLNQGRSLTIHSPWLNPAMAMENCNMPFVIHSIIYFTKELLVKNWGHCL